MPSISNAAGFFFGAFLLSFVLAWIISMAIFGLKSLFWAAYGRNRKSL